ncbi:NADPH-dependent 7-cyano-7-deazaguanine reductase QueF [Litorivivens sp.]|uniref:NADPH-dependent 7-cyano-7-deazaguanine reductase QueF n=1 Tax=Litorivivens sp. TaxID=2020868 RepID=UPI0035625338
MVDFRDLPLGKHTQYPDQYDPGQLRPIPRAQGRAGLEISTLPMRGSDCWNAYELSWLDADGKPQVACGQFVFSADSTHMVESKSFKLYLNSLNSTRFDSLEKLTETLRGDLSAVVDGEVSVEVLLPATWADRYAVSAADGICLDGLSLTDIAASPDAALIKRSGKRGEARYFSELFRSCCPVTGQPDWATIELECRGELPDPQSLLAYLTSFRQNNEFHEQCVERMFSDISRRLNLEALTVYARYTRRGGLDINPLRSSHENSRPFRRLARQ